MKNISEIKKEIENVKKNFNPQKDTYKILDDIVNNNYAAKDIISKISSIKGINKYPNEVKEQFFMILKDLKNIIHIKEEEKKENERREVLKKQQEENTKELKDIIDSLEKRKFNKAKDNDKNCMNSDANNCEKDNDMAVSSSFDDLEIFSKNEDKCVILESKKLFFVLLLLVVIAIISLILVFLFY